MIDNITLVHDISVDDYIALRKSVNFANTTIARIKIALSNSLYTVVIKKDEKTIGMARVVGDGGYVFFICDVIVHPSFQSKGLGRLVIENVLSWIDDQVNPGETVMVNLMSAMNKEPFYEKLGFSKRPYGNHGAGMSKWISK